MRQRWRVLVLVLATGCGEALAPEVQPGTLSGAYTLTFTSTQAAPASVNLRASRQPWPKPMPYSALRAAGSLSSANTSLFFEMTRLRALS